MDTEYLLYRLRRSVAIGSMVAIGVFAGVESVDMTQTFNNRGEIVENEERSTENRERLIELEQKVKFIESRDSGQISLPRICTCVAEDNLKTPRFRVCPVVCDTEDTVRQCESLNPGYQCG